VLRNSLAGAPPVFSADVGVDVTPSAPRSQPKKGHAFDVAVTNGGPNATAGSLTVDVSGVATSASVPDPRCSVQALHVTCSFSSLAAGSSLTIRVSGTVRGKDTVTTTANVDGAVSDPNPLNDTDSGSIQVR
jgi:hypothetical protein